MGKIILNDIEYGIGISNGVNVDTTNLVEKDSIVTTLDDTVTDEQIPSAKAVRTAIQNVSVGVPADVYSKTEVDDLLADKADSTDIIDSYTKEEVDNLLNDKVNTDDLVDAYSKTEVDTLLTGKADSTDIIDAYSKTEVDNLLADKADSSAIEEAKTELENEIANIPKVTKTSELNNDSGFITANDIPEVDLEPYALKTEIPTTLPASDVYAWAKKSTKPTYTASEVGALPSDGTATNASKVSNALTLKIAGTTKNTFNGSSAQTFNIPNASTSTAGVMTADMVTKLNTHATEIDNLKNTVVNGKTSVANAINGKLGTTLSNQTSFADMAYYIGTIPSMASVNKLPTKYTVVRGSFPFVKEVLSAYSLTTSQTVTIDGGLIMFVEEDEREVLRITPINAPIKVYKWDGNSPITVDAGREFTTSYCACFIFNPNRTQLNCVRNGYFPNEKVNPAIYINIS